MLEQAYGVTFPDEFEVEGFDTLVAPGDYVETYQIKLSDSDFEKLINQVKISDKWVGVEDGDYIQRTSEFKFRGFEDVTASIDKRKKCCMCSFQEIENLTKQDLAPRLFSTCSKSNCYSNWRNTIYSLQARLFVRVPYSLLASLNLQPLFYA